MILHVDHISKKFGNKHVLKHVSFSMDSSRLYGITGENGSGKSTLLKIIAGEWKPDSGKVYKNDVIGYCPQNPLLFSNLTVEEHFRYFGAAYGIHLSVAIERSEMLMEYFNFGHYRNEKIGHLSEGTRQKVNLSVALLHKPRLLLLDEPYNSFDWNTYLKFWDYSQRLRSEGCAILVVTHLVTETKRFDKIYNLTNGEIIS